MAQSLFIALKQKYPDSRLDVLAPEWCFPVLTRMKEISSMIEAPFKHGELSLKKRTAIGHELKENGYHQAIILPNSWKSALVPFFAKIPIRTGYLGEFRYALLNDIRYQSSKRGRKTAENYANLSQQRNEPLAELSKPELFIDLANQAKLIKKHSIKNSLKTVALCPGAEFGSSKRWPAAFFASVARQKKDEGWQVLLFGSEKDNAITKEINTLTNMQCVDLAGTTSLVESIDLISLADVVVTNDTGLMHVAAALKKRIVAIFGSSDPKRTPPLSFQTAKICYLGLECSPCYKRECPLGHTHCLKQILPDQIINEIGALCAS